MAFVLKLTSRVNLCAAVVFLQSFMLLMCLLKTEASSTYKCNGNFNYKF